MAKIEVNNLTKVIHKNTVLEDISLSMESGSIYGFQGVNGSGKTMLMRAIIGLIRPTKGSISINGKILGKDLEFPDSIGFLLENPAFLDGYSGLDNLRMLSKVQGNLPDEVLEQWLLRVGLADAGKKKYKKYSLGMKQRLGIAAAVMEEPDIVILDEPSNALDTAGVDMLNELIIEQKERGALVILSCHDTDMLIRLSDVIFKLENGKLIKTEGDK